MTKNNRSITFFGSYPDNFLYSRNQEIRRAFDNLGYQIQELSVISQSSDNPTTQNKSISALFISQLKLLLNYLILFKYFFKVRRSQIIYVPYPSHVSILILKICLIGKRPFIIMDAFLSLYDTIVLDRKLVSEDSLMAKLVYRYEKFVLSFANLILIDTEHQVTMLIDMYGISNERLISIPVGINESIWYPGESKKAYDDAFKVLFWGTFIPLHGIETIIKAAIILEQQALDQIVIELIGTGQTAPDMHAMLQQHWPVNLVWNDGLVEHEQLAEYARNADCVLGIFSRSEKANNVIPYKIYQALAMNKMVVTRQSKSFGDEHADYGIFTVPPESPEALAECLRGLSQNEMNKPKYNPHEYYRISISNEVIESRLNDMMGTIEHG